jgi:membrane-associated phospholipid phosphatase
MNNNRILATIARFTSVIFHPLLIPTIGFLLLFNSDFYFSILPWNVKKYMLLVVFMSTCVLPAVSILILSLSSKFDLNMEKNTDRVLPLFISSISYYLGYLILKRLPVFPVYNVLLIGAVLVQIALIPISMRWKISAHAAAIGGLVGGVLGLSFRLQENPVLFLSVLILAAGLVATSRLILEKHTQSQVYAGFLAGFLILTLVIIFI